jgi:hypothetical protein
MHIRNDNTCVNDDNSNYKIGNGPLSRHVPPDAAFEEPPAAITAWHPVVLPRGLVPTHTAQRLVLTGSFHPVTATVLLLHFVEQRST